METAKAESTGPVGAQAPAGSFAVREYLAEIGRRGGQKSRRKLTKAQARAMVRARTAKRAARNANDES